MVSQQKASKVSCAVLSPFVSMPVGFWNDETGEKYQAAYFDHFKNIWRQHGDWATLTTRGGIIIHGRSDATLNPGGVRIGTAEIYRVVEAFDEITEALVIGQSIGDDVRIVLFVRLAAGHALDETLEAQIKAELKRKRFAACPGCHLQRYRYSAHTFWKNIRSWRCEISCMGAG